MSEREILEAPLTTTLKLDGGNTAPWIVIRSRDAQHLQSQLQELEAGGVGADMGRVLSKLNATFVIGKNLDAAPINPHPSTGALDQPVQAVTPPTPAPVQTVAPTPAPEPVAAPVAPAVPVGANPFDNMPMPAAAPNPFDAQPAGAPDPVWGQPLQGSDPWQTPPAQPAAPVAPGTPIVLGQPAQLVNGPGWVAFADPRPTSVTQGITQDTDDPDDPRLAAGTAKFWKKL